MVKGIFIAQKFTGVDSAMVLKFTDLDDSKESSMFVPRDREFLSHFAVDPEEAVKNWFMNSFTFALPLNSERNYIKIEGEHRVTDFRAWAVKAEIERHGQSADISFDIVKFEINDDCFFAIVVDEGIWVSGYQAFGECKRADWRMTFGDWVNQVQPEVGDDACRKFLVLDKAIKREIAEYNFINSFHMWESV